MKRKVYAAVIAAVVATAAATGCGGSSTSSGGGSGTAASSAGTPAAAAPGGKVPAGPAILVGSVCSCSGPQANSLANSRKVLEAWAAWKNDQGGINGHPVKIEVLDDGGDAAKATQLVKRLVEQDKVQAIVGQQSLVDVAWAPYAAAKGIPVIGASSYNTTFMTAPDFYTTGAQTPSLVFGLVQEAKRAGATKLAVMPCAEAPACAQVPGLVQAFTKIVGGIEMVYSAKVTVSQPSYTANCLAAKGKGADAMIVVENAATVMRVADQCAQQGYRPRQLNFSATVGPAWAKDANMDKTITTQPQPVLADRSIPATQSFHAVLAKYAPDVEKSAEYNESNLWTFSAGEAFALAAKRAKLTPASTGADVTRGLLTFKAETVGGLTPPLTFAAKGPSPLVPCYFVSEIKSGAFTAAAGAKPVCLQSAQVKALGSVLKG